MVETKKMPTAATSEESARERTLRHMRKLLTRGAAAGAALSAAACDEVVVCDPLPPPIECRTGMPGHEYERFMTWSGRWIDMAGTLFVELDLAIYQQPESGRILFPAGSGPTVTNATMNSIDRQDDTLNLRFLPDAGATSVDADVPVDCDAVAQVLRLDVSIAADPQAGDPVTITTRN